MVDGPPPFGETSQAAKFFEEFWQMGLVLDADLNVIAANRLMRAAFGDRLVVGQSVVEALTELRPQGFEDSLLKAIETRQPVVMSERRLDTLAPDGTPVTRWFDYTYHPQVDPDGQVTGILGTWVDVTVQAEARRVVEAELVSMTAQRELSREAVASLQKSLLPDRVPVLASLDVAGAYVLAAEHQAAGGDWFDVVVRQDGRVVLVVGDVVGHGVQASAAMGRLRAVLTEYVESGTPILDVLTALDRRASRQRESFAATVCLVELDPGTGDIAYVCAGHPPPLLVDVRRGLDGARFLAPTHGSPLGTGDVGTVASDVLSLGDVLVLYSDGAVERPGLTPAGGSLGFRRAVVQAVEDVLFPHERTPSTVDRATVQVLQHLDRLGGHADDTTVVAARRRTATEALTVEFLADEDATSTCRHHLREWAAPTLVPADVLLLLQHVLTELVQNVVDHAYLGALGADARPGVVRLAFELDDVGRAVLRVSDDGAWLVRDVQTVEVARGRGLALVRLLVDDVAVDATRSGTVVTVRHRLQRPAGLLRTVSVNATVAHPGTFDVFADPEDPAVVHVVGPVDDRELTDLRTHLALARSAATDTVTVVLEGVTLLASAAISVLFELRDQLQAENVGLQLVSATGSPADQVLTLVNLRSTMPPWQES